MDHIYSIYVSISLSKYISDIAKHVVRILKYLSFQNMICPWDINSLRMNASICDINEYNLNLNLI